MIRYCSPPPVKYDQIELPLTNLHYVTCGEGPPLIMVPATMSKISNWLPLAQFMGQRFTVHFFELPGHGKSTPFPIPYSSRLVAESIEVFLNQLGYSSVALLGFSFGGILALHTLNYLHKRIDEVILISPCVTPNAVMLSRRRKRGVSMFLTLLSIPMVKDLFVRFLHSDALGHHCAAFVRRLGHVENTIPLEDILCGLPASTLDVLIYQANEILNLDFPVHSPPLPNRCYFAMSINDPVLDFDLTLGFLSQNFNELITERFNFPYHQPPVLPTYAELNQDYGHFLGLI